MNLPSSSAEFKKQLNTSDMQNYLQRHQFKNMLRFITCGSVDDGKSTLIGRMLYDSKMIFTDQLDALQRDSKKSGTQREGIDFALLVDGLAAEREQGITIDVAYRFFTTDKCKFIVADTPGHEQYTRNMVTGASTADLSVILLDARKGVLAQTRRHSYICHLLGIRHFILAVNKMDLVAYDSEIYQNICREFAAFADSIGIQSFVPIPLSGLQGDNILDLSANMPWYQGPTLLNQLEHVGTKAQETTHQPFRMPIQYVNRTNDNFRGYSGTISSGILKSGDPVRILPSNITTEVTSLIVSDRSNSALVTQDANQASEGQAICLTLKDEVDCSRGNVLVAPDDPCEVSDQFKTTLVWMDTEELLPGRNYWLKLANQRVGAAVQKIHYQVNINNMEHIPTRTLSANAIASVEIKTDRPIVFEPYSSNKDLGGFILIDPFTQATSGAGIIHFGLRRAANLHWQQIDIDRQAHAQLKQQTPQLLWFTGLSGAGKSTIANALEKRLHSLGRHTFLLDGDNVRQGLNQDLGFTAADRVENIRRIGEVGKLMTDAGLIVLTAFISPFRAEREMVRQMLPANEFIEVFVDTPLEVAEQRDPKGLYRKVRAGELKNFTGIDSPYEPPQTPEIRIDTSVTTVEEAAQQILDWLTNHNRI